LNNRWRGAGPARGAGPHPTSIRPSSPRFREQEPTGRIEPEVAAAIEALPSGPPNSGRRRSSPRACWPSTGSIRGRGPGGGRAARRARASAEAEGRMPKLSRAARRRISIAGSGAVVDASPPWWCRSYPFHRARVSARTPHADRRERRTGKALQSAWNPRVLVDTSPVAWGEKPFENQPIPLKLLPGQKAPPCEPLNREQAIQAGCWIETRRQAPVRSLFRDGDKCYAPVAAARKP